MVHSTDKTIDFFVANRVDALDIIFTGQPTLLSWTRHFGCFGRFSGINTHFGVSSCQLMSLFIPFTG
jgi:hypothetical protein